MFRLSEMSRKKINNNHLKPRERLLINGSDSLSNEELLAIILQTGDKNRTVMELSAYVLAHFNGLYGLKVAEIEELTELEGIGPAKAVQIKAVIELGHRFTLVAQEKHGHIYSSSQLAQMLIEEMRSYHQEHFIVIFLNTKNDIIHKKTLFIGSLNQSVAHPREIFRLAVRFSAARIILAHNHPSGDPEPSAQDELFTSRVVKSGEIIGIEVLDHLVIGHESYMSFRESGKIGS